MVSNNIVLNLCQRNTINLKAIFVPHHPLPTPPPPPSPLSQPFPPSTLQTSSVRKIIPNSAVLSLRQRKTINLKPPFVPLPSSPWSSSSNPSSPTPPHPSPPQPLQPGPSTSTPPPLHKYHQMGHLAGIQTAYIVLETIIFVTWQFICWEIFAGFWVLIERGLTSICFFTGIHKGVVVFYFSLLCCHSVCFVLVFLPPECSPLGWRKLHYGSNCIACLAQLQLHVNYVLR